MTDRAAIVKALLEAQGPAADRHARLRAARDQNAADRLFQRDLGPAEHGAFAEAWTQDNPMIAVPSLLAAIPLYTAFKKMKEAAGYPGASPASLEEMAEAYRGMGRGLQ